MSRRESDPRRLVGPSVRPEAGYEWDVVGRGWALVLRSAFAVLLALGVASESRIGSLALEGVGGGVVGEGKDRTGIQRRCLVRCAL